MSGYWFKVHILYYSDKLSYRDKIFCSLEYHYSESLLYYVFNVMVSHDVGSRRNRRNLVWTFLPNETTSSKLEGGSIVI